MKVWITLDKIDGSKSRLKGPVHADEIDLFGLLMYLNQRDVAGVSFVRADLLNRLDQCEEPDDVT
jgi:hypothetical protein